MCAALGLEKGAATKRWSRLKQAMEKGEILTSSNHQFLWILIKHSARGKVSEQSRNTTYRIALVHDTDRQPYDWQAIADQCNSTKGACSKRYSRLKIAFDKGDAPPSTPSKATPATPKKTPRTSKTKTEDGGEGTPTATPKRKRTLPKKKAVDDDEQKFKAETDDDQEGEVAKPKRAKTTPNAKAKPKPKNGFRASDNRKEAEEAQTVIKSEPVEDDGDVFLDAPEQAAVNVDAEGEVDEVCKFIHLLPLLLPGAIST